MISKKLNTQKKQPKPSPLTGAKSVKKLTKKDNEMPTGYTADVQSGKVETLQDYAFQCARAFGALIMMREESSDAEIPESFKPDTKYHEENLAKAEAILSEVIIDKECERLAKAEFEAAKEEFYKSSLENKVQIERYKAMLVKVNAWEAPKDHLKMKEFMVDQLEKSIDFDARELEMPVQKTGKEWLADRIKKAEWNKEYHSRNIAEEIKRTNDRNKWLADLRESLK